MGVWYIISTCGIWLSVWGTAQLATMGYFFSKRSPMFQADVQVTNYTTFEDFVLQSEKRFDIAAINCFIAAYTYVWILFACVISMMTARMVDKWSDRQELIADEGEYPERKSPKKKSKKLLKKTHTN